jgi:hypothetical protein
LYIGFILVPEVRELADAARELREREQRESTTEAERLRLVNEARKTEIVNNARILVQQEQILRNMDKLHGKDK